MPMSTVHSRFVTPFVLAGALLVAVAAQAQPAKPTNTRDMLIAHWTEISDKFVQLAEDFPDAKYDYKPVETVRSFGDVVRHVAFWNTFVAGTLRGEKVDPAPNELSKTEYATKAAALEALKKSLADATAALRSQPESPELRAANLVTAFIGHTSEHYGQLVVYFRMNGIVPPASRTQ